MSLVNLRLIFVITLLIREISISSLLLCPALRRKGNKIFGFKFNWTALCSSTERTDRQTNSQTERETDIDEKIEKMGSGMVKCSSHWLAAQKVHNSNLSIFILLLFSEKNEIEC